MRRYLLFVVLTLVVLGTSGCIVVHTEEVGSYRSVVEPEGVTLCEIAAGDLAGLLTDRS